MSQACERFFVQEACLYECEPAAGLFRKYNESQKDHPDYNEWQLHKMPIKKSYCDAWYDACKHDYFCGQGSFFGCEAYYWETHKDENKTGGSTENKGLIIGLSVTGALAVIAIGVTFFLITKEKKGTPVFAPPEQAPEGVST
jgi:folate receptor